MVCTGALERSLSSVMVSITSIPGSDAGLCTRRTTFAPSDVDLSEAFPKQSFLFPAHEGGSSTFGIFFLQVLVPFLIGSLPASLVACGLWTRAANPSVSAVGKVGVTRLCVRIGSCWSG